MTWVSPVTAEAGRAIFVDHDHDGFPKQDAILLIGIGRKGDKMKHTFRWPLKLIRKANVVQEVRTIR